MVSRRRTFDDGLGIVVVDEQVGESGWQAVDLARVGLGLGGQARPVGHPLPGPNPRLGRDAFPRGSASFDIATPTSMSRVPGHAVVAIGPNAARRSPAWLAAATTATANDNRIGPTKAARSIVRDMIFIAMLFATVTAAFMSGREHAVQRVIIVPPPSGPHSMVT